MVIGVKWLLYFILGNLLWIGAFLLTGYIGPVKITSKPVVNIPVLYNLLTYKVKISGMDCPIAGIIQLVGALMALFAYLLRDFLL